MKRFFDLICRCWLMYLAGAFLLYFLINRSTLDLQYLDGYRGAGQQLVNCLPSSCSERDFKNGVRYYVHWADYFPKKMEAFNAAGYCFYHLYDFKHAMKYSDHAILLDPSNSALYYNKALELLQTGDYNGALGVLTKGMSLISPEAFIRSGMIPPYKKYIGPEGPNQPEAIYKLALYSYSQLMVLTKQLIAAHDINRKKILNDTLVSKSDTLDLFYYIPYYKSVVKGHDFIMI